jgi:uncharacterized protein (DUF3820 family)
MKPEDLQLLLIREMPYGKYQGRKIADLPGHYLGWFAREGFPRGELGALLALMYELDHNDLRACSIPCGQAKEMCPFNARAEHSLHALPGLSKARERSTPLPGAAGYTGAALLLLTLNE